MTFAQLGLSQPVLQALELKSYTTPTPIQEQAIPTVLEGRDLLGIAQTGTGKTAAFMLPSIDRLIASGKTAQRKCCRMLVLAPTRELAGQIAQSARDYSALTTLRTQSIFGGTSVSKDRQKMMRGSDVLVATPGRLLDLIDQNALSLAGVEILVLDEADQMLDLGFIHALRRIVGLLPQRRQTLFFSATMPNAIKQLADSYLSNPAQVAVRPVATTADLVEQKVVLINQDEKQALIEMIFRGQYSPAGEVVNALVFTRTKHGADRVVRKLGQAGVRADAIHGNKSQSQRERALADFKSGRTKVLVATDIAARGIDISGLSHVINYELPNVPEQYVHRIGRTARAGAKGIALSLCAGDERAYLRDIQKLTGVTLEKLPLPDDFRSAVESGIEHGHEANSRPPRQDRGRKRHPNVRITTPQGKPAPRRNEGDDRAARATGTDGARPAANHPGAKPARSGKPGGFKKWSGGQNRQGGKPAGRTEGGENRGGNQPMRRRRQGARTTS
ncbi:MAG: DEAD/DEAH box helicase [Sphingomonadales bacterium BRH_c42]|nr:MAG: DEAD/DEAH box helicase [Sphingomonadales bacterium BRH_c42]